MHRYGPASLVIVILAVAPGCSTPRYGAVACRGQEGLDVLSADLDGDGLEDILVKRETRQAVEVFVLLSPRFDMASSLRFSKESSVAEDAFCGVRVEAVVECAGEGLGAPAIVRLSDGMCDAFFIEWDPVGKRLRWFRAGYRE